MRTRGLGYVYRPKYRDKKTREICESPTWWIGYSYRGQKKRESSGSKKRNIAVNLLRQRMEELGRGVVVGRDAARVTFVDLKAMLLDDYQVNSRRSLRRAKGALKHLADFFGFHRALDITTDRISAYIRDRQEQEAKPATIHYELAMLKRMFTLAVRAGKLVHKPYFPPIEVRNVRHQIAPLLALSLLAV